MANFDRDDMRRPGSGASGYASAENAPVLIGAAVVVVVLIGMVWYSFSGPSEIPNPPDTGAMHQTTTPPLAPPPPSPMKGPAAPKP